jgi:hypothetical protein
MRSSKYNTGVNNSGRQKKILKCYFIFCLYTIVYQFTCLDSYIINCASRGVGNLILLAMLTTDGGNSGGVGTVGGKFDAGVKDPGGHLAVGVVDTHRQL